MVRQTKKFIYGIFFLSLFFLIGFGVFSLVNKDDEDFISDRNFQLSQIQVIEGKFYVFSPDTVFLSGVVRNLNSGFVLKNGIVSFKIYDEKGLMSDSVRSEIKNFTAGTDRLVYGVKRGMPVKSVGRVELEVEEGEWGLDGGPVLLGQVVLKDQARVVVSEDNILIVGTVANRNASIVNEISVAAVLRDKSGFKYFVTGVTLSSLQGFSEREFQIVLPFLQDLADKARDGSVEVFVY